jgi:hypothetical protein
MVLFGRSTLSQSLDELPQFSMNMKYERSRERNGSSSFLSIVTQCLLLIIALRRVHSNSKPSPPLPPHTTTTTTPTTTTPTTTSQAAALYPRGRDRPHNYQILKDEVHYSGWRKVVRRSVTINNHPHKRIDFDVFDQAQTSGGAVIVFAWNSTSKTATIIREYMPGPHRVLSGLAAGIVEDGKHSGELGEEMSLIAAKYELEEEWYVGSSLLALT